MQWCGRSARTGLRRRAGTRSCRSGRRYMRRPILVAVGVPGLQLIVLPDRIGDTVAFQRRLHVGGGMFEREFRRVDADYDEAAISVLGIEFGDARQCVDAVDAAVGPEIHQHHLAAQVGDMERPGVEPVADADEVGAVSCAAAILNGAVCADVASAAIPGRAVPASRRAMVAADAASERRVMDVSLRGFKGRSGPGGRIRSATPRSACRIGSRRAPRRQSRRRRRPAAVGA